MSFLSDSYRPGQLMRLLQERYVFLGLLGRGGCGLVFEVENRALGRREALKLFSQSIARDGSQRFTQEARIMAALDHPHIVPIYSFGENGGCLWYAMKLVEGPTLAGFLKVNGRPDLTDALRVGIPLLEALAFTHDRGVIHRDIKPANILLDHQAGPILTDFGIAKAESDSHRTETGAFLGTPAYISPEQGLGRQVDGRTDLYAMGMVLYQMLAGRLPFDDGNSLAVMMQRFQMEAQSPRTHRPEIPEDLAAVINQSLATDPDQRFATAPQMRDALIQAADTHGMDWQSPLAIPSGLGPPREPIPDEWSGYLDNGGPTAFLPRSKMTAMHEPTPEVQPPRTSRYAWGLGAMALGAVGVVGWALWHQRRTPAAGGATPAPLPQVSTASPATVPSPAAERWPAKAVTRPLKEPVPPSEPVRRPVTPAQLLDPPTVDPSLDTGCGGKTASVEVQVDASGAVSAARVLSQQLPAACKDAMLKAARSCRFKPALAADGQPVASTTAISIEL